MIDKSGLWRLLFLRFLLGIPFLFGAYFIFRNGGVPSILGVFVMLPAAYLLTDPISSLISNKANVFHSETKHKREPIFGHADKHIQMGELDEAMAVYDEFALEFPDNPEVYVGMIKLAAEYFQDIEMARASLRKGLSKITDKDDRAFLLKNFRILCRQLLKTDEGEDA